LATTIQSLVQSAAPGSTVTVPPGTYDVSGLVLGNIKLQAGGAVTLTGTMKVSGPETVVSGFTFSGGSIDVGRSTGTTIQNCTFKGGGSSIDFFEARDATIVNNSFHNVTGAVIDGWGLDQSTISGNNFYDCYQPINLCFNNIPTQGRDIAIEDNYFTGTGRMPIEVGPVGAYTSNLVVRGNWSENMKNVGVEDGYHTDVAFSIVPTYGVNTLIEGNYAMGPGSIGIELNGSGEITGNYVDNFWYGTIVYGKDFNVHDNALINTSYATVLNYSGQSGTTYNNQTTAAGFPMPQKPGMATPPDVTATLLNDTGASTTDHITSNPALTGTGDPNAVVHFKVDGVAVATTATADATGKWTFTPAGLANGQHTIVASETNQGGTDTAAVTFTLDKTAPAVTAKVASGSTTSSQVLTGTGDSSALVQFTVDGKAIAGSATANSAGAWTYTLNGLTAGQHTVVASEKDVAGNVGKAALTLSVGASSPPPPPPTDDGSVVARDDVYKLDAGKQLWVSSRYLTWNDIGPDGSGKNGGLTVSSVDAKSAHGFDVAFNNGTIVFKPAAGWNGIDSFNYTVKDTAGHTDTAKVVVTVGTGGNTQPPTGGTGNPVIAVDDSYKPIHDKSFYFNTRYLTWNDKGLDGGLKVVALDKVSAKGVSVSWGSDGTAIYKAPTGLKGSTDTLNYTVSDVDGSTDVGHVVLNIL
jgi:hypothetical protein